MKKNCIVLGTGRSGTSLLAGTLAGAGYYIGDKPMPPTVGNPKGYFEAFDIQNINEDILARTIRNRPEGVIGGLFFKHIPVHAQRWLAVVPLTKKMNSSESIIARIREKTSKEPYCFKDPRFCYTLPVWQDYLKNSVFFCVFRQPSITAESILTECQREKYLKNLRIRRSRILRVWNLMYSHVLKIHSQRGDWMFLHCDQIFDESIKNMIEQKIGAPVDRSFPDRSVITDRTESPVPANVQRIYKELCRRANFGPGETP